MQLTICTFHSAVQCAGSHNVQSLTDQTPQYSLALNEVCSSLIKSILSTVLKCSQNVSNIPILFFFTISQISSSFINSSLVFALLALSRKSILLPLVMSVCNKPSSYGWMQNLGDISWWDWDFISLILIYFVIFVSFVLFIFLGFFGFPLWICGHPFQYIPPFSFSTCV